MIRYSNTPKKNKNVLTDSPTSPVVTTRDVRGLQGDNDASENKSALQDLDSEDNNE